MNILLLESDEEQTDRRDEADSRFSQLSKSASNQQKCKTEKKKKTL